MIDMSILQAFSEWVANNWVASTIAGSLSWDLAKSYLYVPFKNKLGKYFDDESNVEQYLEVLHTDKAINNNKPYRDVEDKYEEIVGRSVPEGFIEDLKQLIIENKDLIDEMNSQAKIVFNIKEQKAGRDINNVNGAQIIINKMV